MFREVYSIYGDDYLKEGFTEELEKAYNAGKNGTAYDFTNTGVVDPQAAKVMYTAGREDNAINLAPVGFVSTKAAEGVNTKTVKSLDLLAKTFGVKIAFVDKLRGGNANGQYHNGTILIARDAVNPIMVVAKHEITHHLAKVAPDAFKRFADYAVKVMAAPLTGNTTALISNVINNAKNDGVRLSESGAREEIAAEFTEFILANDGEFNKFIREMNRTKEGRNAAQRFIDAIKDFLYKIKALFNKDQAAANREAISTFGATIKQLENAAKLWEDLAKAGANKNTTENDGVMYSLKVKEINGKQHIVSPETLTRDGVLNYLEMSRKGKLKEHTYFPISAYTPDVIIDTLNNAGIAVEDRPLAMQAKKAKQSQAEGKPHHSNGVIIRHHALKAEEILEAIDKLSNTTMIIQETNRTKKIIVDGETIIVDAPDSFVAFVSLDSGKECVVVLEFNSSIEEQFISPDGKGDEYHTTVTVFEPDVVRDGLPFDYAEYLLLKESNRELGIIRKSSDTKAAYGETYATASETELSKRNVPQKAETVKYSLSKADTVYLSAVNRGDMETAQRFNAENEDIRRSSKKSYVDILSAQRKMFGTMKPGESPFRFAPSLFKSLLTIIHAENKKDTLGVSSLFCLCATKKIFSAVSRMNSNPHTNCYSLRCLWRRSKFS